MSLLLPTTSPHSKKQLPITLKKELKKRKEKNALDSRRNLCLQIQERGRYVWNWKPIGTYGKRAKWDGKVCYITINLSLKKQSYESSLKKKKILSKELAPTKGKWKNTISLFLKKIMLVSFWGSGVM